MAALTQGDQVLEGAVAFIAIQVVNGETVAAGGVVEMVAVFAAPAASRLISRAISFQLDG
jgi:hypothetical protein